MRRSLRARPAAARETFSSSCVPAPSFKRSTAKAWSSPATRSASRVVARRSRAVTASAKARRTRLATAWRANAARPRLAAKRASAAADPLSTLAGDLERLFE